MINCAGGCGAIQEGKKVMNKLILFTAALLVAGQVVAGQASVYAESSDHISKHHKRMMSAHARYLGQEDGINYRAREFAPDMYAPPYGSYGDDPSAEGRTSGG
jgi:hypothetical protein